MAVVKVIELVGESKTGWEDAVRQAVRQAAKTVRNISGVEVLNWTANVNPVDGSIVEYKADIQIAFRVEGTD
ncbi:MAG TPA: dodecin family protein [Limnochordales bacterium]